MSENTEKFVLSVKNNNREAAKNYLKKVLRERIKIRVNEVLESNK